jgi:succinyl-CoA synthetase beta subunit
MKIHEYQAKELFANQQIPIPQGSMVTSVDQAVDAADKLGGYPVVVKAQIHAGGRGKGGGVKLAKSKEEVHEVASSILGMDLVTHQTGPQGQTVKKLLVEQGLDIAHEMYMSVIPDRASAKVVIMASMAWGVDIEEVAEKTPEKIIKVAVDPMLGIQAYHCRQVAFGLDLPAEARKECMALVSNLYKVLMAYDCSLVEINPLVLTTDNHLLALDAKINFDDNALFRHKDILNYRDVDEEDPLEVEASKYGLNYIKMDGNVGNMVNGAGLAMATMDIIKKAGAEPANFLDVGGGASAEMVENGFRIILGDPHVKGIFINIFGGILRCDVWAQGVVQAATKVGLNVPVVVRMEGTNVEQGRQILAESGLDLRTAKDLADAAQQVAALVN